ncbi:MAG: exonuclease SbcCD subunit D, partial [Vulcanimicrobiota bacterium]
MKFIHCADIHLGQTINGNKERYKDFFYAFDQVACHAIKNRVDCIIIAGDLFQHGNLNPRTLGDSVEIFEKIRNEKIPVIAIEGNHDFFRRGRKDSWLAYLARRGFLRLLRPGRNIEEGTYVFEPLDPATGVGGWTEIKGYRIYGFGYWPSRVAERLEKALENLSEVVDVGILHAGVWDFDVTGKISPDEIRKFSNRFRYLALGHGHKKKEISNETGRVFAYNPGSLEAINIKEADYHDGKGFAYLVNLEDELTEVTPLEIERRPFHNLKIDVTGAESPEKVNKTTEYFINGFLEDKNFARKP